MAMSASSLAQRAAGKLAAKGWKLDNQHAKTKEMLNALAEAVVEEIQANATAMVGHGSSQGPHPIK